MTDRLVAPACKPPSGITGLNPVWSRLVDAPDADGITRTWHLLDSWAVRSTGEVAPPELTILCVHGNPSWSFLWRHILALAPDSIRVIAVDQLDMGYSERTGVKRTLAMRVEDLCQLTEVLGMTGPVVSLAHDWGGPVSLGWALRHLRDDIGTVEPGAQIDATGLWLTGVVLTNTAVHQPESASAPSVIRLIRSRPLLRAVTVWSRAFIHGAIQMSRPVLGRDVQTGFMAPYTHASRRTAIADFVSDIPLDKNHESATCLDEIAHGMDRLARVPALLLWGPRDKVFSDLYLHDLENRLPHADVHRFPDAAHFVTEDADIAGAVCTWVRQFQPHAIRADGALSEIKSDLAGNAETPNTSPNGPARALADFSLADDEADAVVELAPLERSISFGELKTQTDLLAAGMSAFGINAGDRIAVMITPGIHLALVVYACWRLGATLVLVDSGLGRNGMQGALKSANPAYLFGIDKALVAARVLGWPGRRIATGSRSAAKMRTLGIISDIDALCRLGQNSKVPTWPDADTVAALAFTSGSTGPSKGVVYLHRQIQAQRDALMRLYGITGDDRLVAAFAPFALYGPTMGITSCVPDMDVTKPSTLTAQSLATAVERLNATLVFASPAALVNVVATQQALSGDARAACAKVRLTLSAGAPIRASLLESSRGVFTNARFHTPYGMTEVLPVADISLDELQALEAQNNSDQSLLPAWAGVCVGHPVDSVSVQIDPLDKNGKATGELTTQADILGEIIVRAPHIRHAYDRLWLTHHMSSIPQGTHRSGDIGQLDQEGRLWVGGRLGHVIVTSAGPIAPVAGEQFIESIDEVAMACLVGVGPPGTQAVVAVVQMKDDKHPTGGASLELIDKVRLVMTDGVDVTAVLVASQLPVDRRHNSKIDRTAIAGWASRVLAGDKVAAL
ncbi:MAG: alpha/beta fold hydrolase [Granulosicoccus sp.]